MPYNYIIKPRAQQKIRTFYRNVARKYRHTYDYDDFMHNVYDAVFSIYDIEKTLPRRVPTISRWKGYYMANSNKWYFAYTIEGDTITIVDACHAQNMVD
jgi:hypothetical protein